MIQSEVRRILYIRTDRMGDVLMNLPAIRVLRQTWPKAWITLLVDYSVRDLFKEHPDLDELMTADGARVSRNLSRWVKLFSDVRGAGYDLVVVANAEKSLHLLTFLAGIRHRAGWKRKWGFLLNHALADQKASSGRHEIDSNLELIKLVSKEVWDGTLKIAVDEAAKKRVDEKIAKEFPDNKKIIVIHGGTSNPRKRWGREKFANLGGRFSKRGDLGLLLIGGPEEKVVASEIKASIAKNIQDWTGETSLKDLAALFHHPRVAALVSCDSGPVHVAWMSGVPVVALYAKNVEGSDPARWGPKDARSRVVYKKMDEISVDEVEKALDEVLAEQQVSR